MLIEQAIRDIDRDEAELCNSSHSMFVMVFIKNTIKDYQVGRHFISKYPGLVKLLKAQSRKSRWKEYVKQVNCNSRKTYYDHLDMLKGYQTAKRFLFEGNFLRNFLDNYGFTRVNVDYLRKMIRYVKLPFVK